MLSSADQQLVRRDPCLPGLAVLLDEKEFSQRLVRQLPGWENRQLTCTYLRYKPGTNCLAAYRVQSAPSGSVREEPFPLYAKAFRSKDVPKFLKEATSAGPMGRPADDLCIFPNEAIMVRFFPTDRRLEALRELISPERGKLLGKLLPEDAELWGAMPQVISYKPERRCVLRLEGSSGERATVRCYARREFAAADAYGFRSCGILQIPERLGRSRRHQLLSFEWLDGRCLGELLPDPSCEVMRKTGEALAEFHLQDVHGLRFRTRRDEVRDLRSIARTAGRLCPELSHRSIELAREVAKRLMEMPATAYPIHGDFYADQVLVSADRMTVLDFDEAVFGDPSSDLGNFAAHLDRHVADRRLSVDAVENLVDNFLTGYRKLRDVAPQRVAVYRAANLFRQVTDPFRARRPDWPEHIEAIISRVEALLKSCGPAELFVRRKTAKLLPSPSVTIDDRGVLHDPKLEFVAPALDTQQVVEQFKRILCHRPEIQESLRLRSIRVPRHKPGRRCLIEYEFAPADTPNDSFRRTLIGKVSAKRPDLFSYRIQQMLCEGPFHPAAGDGICVPQILGLVPDWHMWLQQKVEGARVTEHLESEGAEPLVARVAQAIHKLHSTAVPVRRRHTPRDELGILHKRVPKVLRNRREWQEPVRRILSACDRLAASLPENCDTFIHRDFYPDQLLIERETVTLLDFDLSCLGDPALDLGNFHAHLTEHALRHKGEPDALAGIKNAFLGNYLVLAGEDLLSRIQAYSTLTLVRHIYLSTLFADRRHLMPQLIELSARQLGVRLKDSAAVCASIQRE